MNHVSCQPVVIALFGLSLLPAEPEPHGSTSGVVMMVQLLSIIIISKNLLNHAAIFQTALPRTFNVNKNPCRPIRTYLGIHNMLVKKNNNFKKGQVSSSVSDPVTGTGDNVPLIWRVNIIRTGFCFVFFFPKLKFHLSGCALRRVPVCQPAAGL